MKLPQDTLQNKVSSSLLPALLNQGNEGIAAKSQRGFAESLRHQLSAAAETAKAPVRAATQKVVTQKADRQQPDIKKSEHSKRGTILPADEQKLPADHNRTNSTSTVETQQRAPQEKSVLANDKQSTAQSSQKNSQNKPLQVNKSVANNDNAGKVAAHSPEQPSEAPPEQSAAVGKRDSGVIADEQVPDGSAIVLAIQAQAVAPTAAAPVLFDSTWSQTDKQAALAGPLINGLWTGSAANSDQEVKTRSDPGSALTSIDAVSPSTTALMVATSVATTAGTAGGKPTALPLDLLSAVAQGTDGAFEADALPMLSPSTQPDAALIAELQPLAFQQTPSANRGAQTAPAAASTTETATLFDAMLSSGYGLDDIARGPAVPGSLQYASMLSASDGAGIQSAALAETPITKVLMSELVSSQQIFNAPQDAESLATRVSSGAGAAAANTASGIATSLYSQDQRYQAAVEARHAQVQTNQGIDTSLATTSALKLPGLDITFGQAGWADRIGRQLLLQSAQGSSMAQIRLDPPELGSLTVRIQLVDQSAVVDFISPHAMVRDALEQQAGRLQEMFREQGMNLEDVSVSDQSAHPDSNEQRDSQGAGSASLTRAGDEGAATETIVRQSESLIDYYA